MRRIWFCCLVLGSIVPFLAASMASAQTGPNGRPGPGGMRGPGGGPGGGPGPGQGPGQGPGPGAGPNAPAGEVAWTDVQVHLRAGGGRNFDSVIETALAETAPLGRRMLVLVPPPFPSETANANAHEYEVFLAAVRRHPAELAFLGGAKLNALLQATPPGAVTPDLRQRFAAQAAKTLDDGARGFGELALLHFSEFDGHPYERVEPDHPLMLALADIAAARNAPIAVHMEAVPVAMDLPAGLASPPNPRRIEANIAAFERLLSHNPAARIVWLHNGWDNTGQRTPPLVQQLMAAHPNLALALKFHRSRSGLNQVVSPGGPNADWMAVLRTYPDRIVIGSDSFFAAGTGRAGTIFEPRPITALLSRLPPPLAQRIGVRNAERLYNLPAR
jgi:predicted TIM-barrel fold metal-dependent hydrolase